MTIHGLIFDLDGTLVDSFQAIHASLQSAMGSLGMTPWDYATTVRNVGRGLGHLIEAAVGRDRKAEALERFRADYAATCLTRTSLLPGVAETLPRLKASGRRLAVATNKSLPFTLQILGHFGIHSHFDCVLAPEEVARPKPHPDMIRAVLRRLDLPARHCLYVGDMPLDVETATRAGVGCMLVATGFYPFEELARTVSVPVVRRFSQVADALDPQAQGPCGPP
ncbi:MAG: HAD-IA family hydrolase [bacterium]